MTLQNYPASEIRGRNVLILGYGREGRSVHAFLRARYPALEVCIADARPIEGPLESCRDCICGPDYLEQVSRFDTAILSPGIAIPAALLQQWRATTWLTSATNLFMAHAPGTLLGVTGTKGKSTTSALIAALLRTAHEDVRLVGNIGKPALDYLEGANAQTFFVQELSSYQLEFCRYSPRVAVLLNIVPEHLDRHGSFEAYAAAKLNIAAQQGGGDSLVYSADFPFLASLVAEARGTAHRYSRSANDGVDFVEREDKLFACSAGGQRTEIFEISKSALRGPGNIENMLAACTAAACCGVAPQAMAAALSTFQPLEHRLEFVAEVAGVRYINDSLSTIPEALQQALGAYAGEVGSVIAGGFDRGIGYELAAEALLNARVPLIILLPTTGARIAQELNAQSSKVAAAEVPQVVQVETLEQAVSLAKERTSRGKVCLFSPAASSYNQFRDYRERGERFRQLVRDR